MGAARQIPPEIKQLRLSSALNGCGSRVEDAFDECQAADISVYNNETSHATEWLPVDTADSKHLHISNPTARNIVLLPLDNSIIKGPNVSAGGVADCALLTSDLLMMVEFKTNVYNNEDYNLKEKTDKAISQLWRTYDDIICRRCHRRGVELEDLVDVEFYIKFDRNLEVSHVTAERMEAQERFKADHRGHLLFFDHGRVI